MPGANAPQEQPPEKKFWEGPYPAMQVHLKRREDLAKIRTNGDEQEQQRINKYNDMAAKIEKMAERLK